MDNIEFAVSGSFEQLSWFKEEAEKLGWNYVSEFTEFTEKNYRSSKPRLLYFCEEGIWDCGNHDNIVNGFSLSGGSDGAPVFNLDVDKHKALLAIAHNLDVSPIADFLDFIIDNYTIINGDIINNEHNIENKKQVITMYGQTKV